MVVYLTGFMGCGKSSVGRRLARALGYAFADTDHLVEETAGKGIAAIFAEDGEAAFRRIEREVLQRTADMNRTVVATGGGMPCGEGNVEFMNAHGAVFYLKSSVGRLVGNLLAGDRSRRPKIAGLGNEELCEYVRTTLAAREERYAKAAFTVECDGRSDYGIVAEIAACVAERQGGGAERVVTRPMREEEVPLLAEFLYDAIWQEDGAQALPRSVIRHPEIWAYIDGFGTAEGDVCVVAEVSGVIVGAAWARRMHGYGFVADDMPELAVSVRRQWRGRGIGTRLVRELLMTLRDGGCKGVSLSVDRHNPAVEMYRRLGFGVVREDDSGYVMTLML